MKKRKLTMGLQASSFTPRWFNFKLCWGSQAKFIFGIFLKFTSRGGEGMAGAAAILGYYRWVNNLNLNV